MSLPGTKLVFDGALGHDRAPLTEADQYYHFLIFALFALAVGAAVNLWRPARVLYAHWRPLARAAHAELVAANVV